MFLTVRGHLKGRSPAARSRLKPSPSVTARRSTSTPADQIVERLNLFQQRACGPRPPGLLRGQGQLRAGDSQAARRPGAGFDIVSGGELERVLAAAPEAADRVVFSGVGKTAAEIDLALKSGILQFNVESEAELALLAAARQSSKSAPASPCASIPTSLPTRIPTSPPACASTSSASTSARRSHLQERGQHRWLEAYGVSVHIGSQIRSADPFGAAMQRVSKLWQLRREGIILQAIDAGGGLGIDYHGGPSFDAAAKVAEYAAALEHASATSKAVCSSSRAASSSPRPALSSPACST
jgi:diaminopimelate decarboxylase